MKKVLIYPIILLSVPLLLFYYLTINLVNVLSKSWNEMIDKLNEITELYIEELEE